MLILEAAYSLAPGKIHWKNADSCKIMMFMNNDRGGLRGFTHILVPGSKKLAGWSLSGECHKIHGGKYYKSCLAGKQSCVRVFMRLSVIVGLPSSTSWGFVDATCMCELWHTNNVQSCVNEQERDGGRVRGKYKLILRMLWHHEVEDKHSHRVFRPEKGAPQKSQTGTGTQGDAWKGHLRQAHQRPSKSKTSIDRGHRGRRQKTINKSTQLYSTRR